MKLKKLAVPFRLPKWEGGVRYYKSVLQAIDELILDGELMVNFHGLSVSRWLMKHESFTMRFDSTLRILDVLRSPFYYSFPQPLSRFSRESFAWIPDFQDVELPHFFSDDQRKSRKESIERGISKNYLFYFSSHHAKSIFELNFGMNHRIAGVVRFSVSRTPELTHDDESLPFDCETCAKNGFIYLPNQWWKHKNHLFFLRAYKQYLANSGSLHLVLTGSSDDWREPSYAEQIIQMIQDSNNIHNLGLIDRKAVNVLFKKCACVVQPSLYEGWSTSLEEAICSGTGIIASSIEVHKEQLLGIENSKFFNFESIDESSLSLFSLPSRVSEEVASSQQEIRWNRFKAELRDVLNQAGIDS